MRKTLVFLAAFIASCVMTPLSSPGTHDARPITVQTLSMFSQRQNSMTSGAPWRGDWIFRRERLRLVDAQLRTARPDLVFFQNAMNKTGSSSDADEEILLAGALADYQWRSETMAQYSDTQETETIAVAAVEPLKILPRPVSGTSFWRLGDSGVVSLAIIQAGDEPVAAFNVVMPSGGGDFWYTLLQQTIIQALADAHLCKERVIVAGYMPGRSTSARIQEFLASLSLKDVAQGHCQISTQCHTSTPNNEIYLSTTSATTSESSQTDRIYVNSGTYVARSQRNIDHADDSTLALAKRYGLGAIWPSDRFGWTAAVRLPRCLL